MNEKEIDMNELINHCDTYQQVVDELMSEKMDLEHNWNELKKWLIQLQKFKGINQQGFSWGVAQEVLDKIKELEEGGNNE